MQSSTITTHRIGAALDCLDIENRHASARIALLGAQVLSFTPRSDGRDRLFVSRSACLDGSKPVRGGIPVCWPWFGAHPSGSPLPAHGYVRTRQWRLLDSGDHDNHTRLVLEPVDANGAGFAGTATLRLEILVGETLSLQLTTRNSGTQDFAFGAALHTYFSVADVRRSTLQGLQGSYTDKNLDWARGTTAQPYRFAAATDRIHLHAAPLLRIEQDSGTVTTLHCAGHDSIVVWNPWAGCSRQFSDLGEDDWPRMLCVETALTQGCVLGGGQSHTLELVIA